MINLYQSFWQLLHSLDISEDIQQELLQKTHLKLDNPIRGDYPKWHNALNNLPNLKSVQTTTDNDVICIKSHVSKQQETLIKGCYQQLIPWRKGPFQICNTYIDAEWQSFMKWNRIQEHLPELTNKRILDVGCGNGYYMFRMSTHKPKLIMGIDPGLLQLLQFWSIEKYAQTGAAVLPLSMQDLPQKLNFFDVVFSMGVLYHRKSPIHHLKELANTIKNNGHLVLETLIVEGDESTCLIPHNRYAQMRNVWFLPSVGMLKIMLSRCGFKSIKCINLTETTIQEQRTTQWMKFHSLKEFLNKGQDKTIEGYTLPKRATIIAKKIC